MDQMLGEPGGFGVAGDDLGHLSDPADYAHAADEDYNADYDAHPGVDAADNVDGDPNEYQEHWFYQERDGLCGPSTVAQVVSEYTGLDIDNPEYMEDRAVELGLFADGDPAKGMTIDNLEVLLEDQGVPCHVEHSSMADLETRLEGGYGVIAFVDSDRIWGQPDDDGGKPDHVVVVAAVDEEKGVVYLSDPGNPDGNMEEVPIDVFEQSWASSDHTMLVADQPAPDDQHERPDSQPHRPEPDRSVSGTPDLGDWSKWAVIDLRDLRSPTR